MAFVNSCSYVRWAARQLIEENTIRLAQLEAFSRFVRDVSAPSLHSDSSCVDRIVFKVAGLSHTNIVAITDSKEIISWAKIIKTYYSTTAWGGSNNARTAWTS